ncbi:hypothetical protein F5883DRAFT_596678 [Diaporthe sp. PMI_573]|nr:hypothetical protein F5883DRAFT_596678 [Diaporthaceae sp. PMI_573]
MASELRPDFHGNPEPQADLDIQGCSESDSGSESPGSLEPLSSTEDIQDMRPGTPDSSHTWFDDIQDNLVCYDTLRPGSPSTKPLWSIVRATCQDEFVSFPNMVPRIYLEGIGTVWIPTVEAVCTRATDLDAETVRPYIPGEWWLPPTWSVHCATYRWKSSTDKYMETTLSIRSFVSLEEIDGCIGAGNIIIPPSFTTWRKFAIVTMRSSRESIPSLKF